MSRWRRDTPSFVGEGGFTLVELLVVLVILPLLIGAIAEVVIVAVQNDTTVQARVSDSMNAQLTSAYFVRDVQGATQITTDPAIFSAGAACGPSSSTGTPLVALTGPGLNVGYWLQAPGTSSAAVTRYSCSGSKVSVTVADVPSDFPTTGITATASISPVQIALAAQNGWALTAASTPVASIQTLGTTLDVDSTNGFAVGSTPGGTLCAVTTSHPSWTTADGCSGGTINVATPTGTAQLVCKGIAATSFTSCSGATGTAVGSVTQSAISAVQIAVGEPTGAYHYNLVAAPTSGPGACTLPGGCSGKGPALLALTGTGITFKGGGTFNCADGTTAHLCITGSVLADGGVINCQSGNIDASQGIYAVNSSGSSCNSLTINSSGGLGDYVAGTLPLCFQTSVMTNQGLGTPSNATSGLLTPGIYTGALNGATLEPGVYVLEGGVSGSVSMAPATKTDKWYQNPPGSGTANYDPNAGVLLYVPGPPLPDEPSGCLDDAASPGIAPVAGNSTLTLVPMDGNQSSFWFSNSPALTDFWVWQTRTNSTALTMSGNQTITTGTPPSTSSPSGMAYLPSATLVTSSGSPRVYAGCMIVGGVQLNGTPGITLSGNC